MFKNTNSFNVLYTTKVKETHDFFKKIGAEIKQIENDKVVVGFGSFDLHFILNITEPFEEYKYIAKPDQYGQGVIFYIETDDIKKLEEILKIAGTNIKTKIFENHWSCFELLFEDPNGYKFSIYQEK